MSRSRRHRAKADAPVAGRDAPPQRLRDAPANGFWTLPLAGLVAVGIALRLWYIVQPMRYDEAVTYLYFAGKPWATALGSYAYPNNHVFHTALVKVCATVFGNSPVVLRLPAFVAGVAMVPVTFAVGRRMVGDTAAYFGTALVASSGALTLFSTNSRGYTMVCLATMVLLLLLTRLRETPSRAAWIGVIATATLGLWTVPVMLYPAGGLALWFLVAALRGETSDRNGDVRALLLAVLATAVITALLYSPILAHDGIGALTRNRFVAPMAGRAFLSELSDGIGPLLALWTTGLPGVAVVLLIAVFFIGAVRLRDTSRPHTSIAFVMVIWCVAVLLLTHHAPFARVWLFLFAPGCLLAGRGIARVAARLPLTRRASPAALPMASMMLAVLLATSVIATRGVGKSLDTGTLPDAAAIARLLRPVLQRGDVVIAPVPSNAPLQYAFLRAGVDTAYLSPPSTITRTPYLVLNTGEGFTIESTVSAELASTYPQAQLMGTFPFAEVYRLQKPGTLPR